MLQAPYLLDESRREVVLAAIQKHCAIRCWKLLAAHVRSNHVHVIVDAEIRPEKMMNEFKSYASRALNQFGVDRTDRKRWARHGSTRWLWKDEEVRRAVQYVIGEQGEAMAVFVCEEYRCDL
jgi:REP element-mobilizing transposase RayT